MIFSFLERLSNFHNGSSAHSYAFIGIEEISINRCKIILKKLSSLILVKIKRRYSLPLAVSSSSHICPFQLPCSVFVNIRILWAYGYCSNWFPLLEDSFLGSCHIFKSNWTILSYKEILPHFSLVCFISHNVSLSLILESRHLWNLPFSPVHEHHRKQFWVPIMISLFIWTTQHHFAMIFILGLSRLI